MSATCLPTIAAAASDRALGFSPSQDSDRKFLDGSFCLLVQPQFRS
jgi:hypothetical protein